MCDSVTNCEQVKVALGLTHYKFSTLLTKTSTAENYVEATAFLFEQ